MGGTSPHTPVQIVLCFDGTGNTFRADGTETNILKICRMSPRSDHQLVYYQPGIGTEITTGSLAATTLRKSSRLGKSKTLSQALGKSFDQHVLGGYRFLMRHYRTDGNIYIFGFSRGAYTARFLAEMLDWVGLLGPDNEEMIPFIWDAFSRWKLTRYSDTDKRQSSMQFLNHCRMTLCRPVIRVRFLGLFDTVNSIADFEINNDDRSSARVIRHAVSIDERRVKFQPVLLPGPRKYQNWRHWRAAAQLIQQKLMQQLRQQVLGSVGPQQQLAGPAVSGSTENLGSTENRTGVDNEGCSISHQLPELGENDDEDEDEEIQDVQEVWFPGSHADIGGGFQLEPGELWQLSHVPLVWMVQEAQRAGLEFDQQKLKYFNCLGEQHLDPSSRNDFYEALRQSSMKGVLHDRLSFGNGLSAASVLAWRFMEYLPIRRASLQEDGRFKLVHWPLHRGENRDMPPDAQVHCSSIRRMQSNSDYRPGNVIIGGGGRGVRQAPQQYGIGKWEIYRYEGDLTRETYVRKV